MATTDAGRQFEYAWGLYQRGERGEQLWSNIANYAKTHSLPESYRLPLHSLKTVAKSPKTEPRAAMRAFVLSCELARKNKGLNHHVVLLCATRAGLLQSSSDKVTQAMVDKAKQLLSDGRVDLPTSKASVEKANVPSELTPRPISVDEQAETTRLHQVSADIDVYRFGRTWLIVKAQQSLSLAEEMAELLVDLHLDPQYFPMDIVADYGPIQMALHGGTAREAIIPMLLFEDVASILGIFRVHCRNLVNRQGVTDVNTGGPNPPKAPRILQFLDSLNEYNWQSFDDIAALAEHYHAVAETAPTGIFDTADVDSFTVATQLGNRLREIQSSKSSAFGIKQGWLKVFKGTADGVRYLRRFGFDAERFRTHIRNHLNNFQDTEALVRDYQLSIAEVGPALAPNFFADLGFAEFSKPDTHVRKAVQLIAGREMSDKDVFSYVYEHAKQYSVAPRQLDKIFYLIGSGNFYLADFHLSGDGDGRRAEFVHSLPAVDADR